MPETDPAADVRNALDELVHQFADPLAFLRELVQNAIDAGSAEIEVSVEFTPDEDTPVGAQQPGVLALAVQDWGGGMDREIIETRLTRLFSSSKDGDLTKIGKFGVGFVSVFALEPDAICIDTSRDGESWRVLFDRARNYKLLRRDEPCEGTCVRVLKGTTYAEARRVRGRAREVLTYWCKHVRAEIRFDGDPIQQPFALAGAISVEHDDGFSRVVVGHAPDAATFHGYYNQGLTLLELDHARAAPEGWRDEQDLAGISFKVSSPHLEHTLTRDRVIQDRAYDRAMASVRAQIDGPLLTRVLELLTTAQRGHADRAQLDRAYAALAWHLARASTPSSVWNAAVIDVVAHEGGDAHGEGATRRATLAEVREAGKRERLLTTSTLGPLAQAVAREGRLIVILPPISGAMERCLQACSSQGTVDVHRTYGVALPARDEVEVKRYGPLRAAVTALLGALGAKVSAVEVGHLAYPGSPLHRRVAITDDGPGRAVELSRTAELQSGWFGRSRRVVLNADHTTVDVLVDLAAHEPELAAYLAVKLMLVGVGLEAALDAKLAGLAVEARWRRVAT